MQGGPGIATLVSEMCAAEGAVGVELRAVRGHDGLGEARPGDDTTQRMADEGYPRERHEHLRYMRMHLRARAPHSQRWSRTHASIYGWGIYSLV